MSSRNLPDDDSVSFLIPSNADSSNLLEDVYYEFFGAADDFLNTPMPPNKSKPTLVTLGVPNSNDLVSKTKLSLPHNTPAASHSKATKLAPPSVVPFDIPHSDCLVGKTRLPPPQNTPIEAPHIKIAKRTSRGKNSKSISEDAENIPVTDIDSPTSLGGKLQQPPGVKGVELPLSPEPLERNSKGKPRRTVMNGRINKLPKRAVHKLSNLRSISETRNPIQESRPFSSSSSEDDTLAITINPPNSSDAFNGEKAAQYLVGQKLFEIDSITTDLSSNKDILVEPRTLETLEQPAQINTQHIDGDRLTVSKLSPLKCDQNSSSVTVPVPVSPMRPSEKRPSEGTKGFETIVHNSVKVAIADRIREKQPKTTRRKNGVPSASFPKRLKAKTAPLKQVPVVDKGMAKTGLKIGAPQSRTKQLETTQADKYGSDIGRKLHASQLIPSEKRIQLRSFSNPSASSTLQALPKLTMPTGFRFELDVRMEARKTGSEQKAWKRSKTHHEIEVIPGSTESHATQSASSSIRKEQRVPVIPVGFSFSTESRAKERERFDEQVRAKQQEHERQLEEQRRQKELEEERAVKELRKRAIPRANEVPEWYARMPKRKGNNEGALE